MADKAKQIIKESFQKSNIKSQQAIQKKPATPPPSQDGTGKKN